MCVPGQPRLTLLIVSFNTRDLTLACLRSIEQFSPSCPFEIILVDNDSRDDSVERVRKEFPHVRLVTLDQNLGFAGANNVGMRMAEGDIVVLLNSDTEVHAGALDALSRAFDEEPAAAAIGGRLLNSDGSLQFAMRYAPRVSNALSESLFLHHVIPGPWGGEVEKRPQKYAQRCEAEWLSGAYLAAWKSWIDRVGGLDQGFFMYSEDTDWCARFRAAGGRVVYVPDSIVTHHGGGSSGGNPRLFVMRSLARDRYARIHFTRARAAAYRAALVLGLLIRATLALPIAPFHSKYRAMCKGCANAIVSLYRDPLPKEPKHEL